MFNLNYFSMATMFEKMVRSELLDTIALNRLNGVDMDWTDEKIDALVQSIMFDINEVGPDSYDLDEIIKWNLDQNLTHG